MNVSRPLPTPSTTPAVVVPFVAGTRLGTRERDFGVGYGKSSGYATARRYSPQSQPRYFRFA